MKTFSALLRAATPILVMVIPVLGQAPIVSGIVNGAGGSTFSPGTLGLVIGRDFVPAPVNCATATAWVEWCSGLGIGITDANGKKVQAAIGAVTPTQTTFQVPVDLALGQAIAIVIRSVGSQFFGAEMRPLNLVAYAPGLSIRNDAGKTIGTFLDNVSGPILTSKPVNPGDLASVLGFGLGPTKPVVPTGQMPVAPVNTTAQPVLRVAWLSAPIRYSFQVPGSVGAYQIGFRVPAATPDLFQGAVATRPAKPNGTVILFGTGFGLTEPAVSPSETFSGAAPLVSSNPLTIKIGGKVAKVHFAGLVSHGLYQFNVEIPEWEPGDHLVVAEIGGSATQALRYITVGS